MQADADAALSYLTSTRRLPIASIVVYGTGAGGSIAVHLAAQYPLLPAVILQSPDGDYGGRVKHDPRASLVPFWLLFNQNFALAKPLHDLKTPVLTTSNGDSPAAVRQAVLAFVHAYVLTPSVARP